MHLHVVFDEIVKRYVIEDCITGERLCTARGRVRQFTNVLRADKVAANLNFIDLATEAGFRIDVPGATQCDMHGPRE